MQKEGTLLENQLCFEIYEVHRLFNKFYQQSLIEFGLTYPQYIVLLALWDKDNQQLKELAQVLNLKSNTLTPLLKRLEDNEWIVRKKIKSDKRQLLVKLTPKAKKNKEKILRTVKTCAKVGEEEITNLKALKTEIEKLKKKLKMVVFSRDDRKEIVEFTRKEMED